jgi:hypothetical protein
MGWGREGRVEVAGMKVGNEGTGMRDGDKGRR